MSKSDQIPIIDVAALYSGDDKALDELAAEIGAACRGLGFFIVTGHQVSKTLLESIFDQAARFFHAPDDIKRAVSFDTNDHNRGWIGMEREALDPGKAPDHKEAFNIGLDLAADDPQIKAGVPFRGLNLWPDVPGFKDTALDYYNAVWALSCALHRAFARDLGIEDTFFDDKLDAPLATLRLLHYPAPDSPRPEGQIGAGEHTDYGNITLLLTDGTAGLEVRARDGRWIAAPHVETGFICNIGDCLMRWTNDVYVSTPHRVQLPPAERYSIAFFLDPNPDAEVSVLDACTDEQNPAKYPPVSGADYLRQRLDASYAFLKEGTG